MKRLFLTFVCCLFLTQSCNEKDSNESDISQSNDESTKIPNEEVKVSLDLSFSTSPITLNDSNVKFSKDISYSTDVRNKFDIFLPDSSTPTSLVIYIHGGGFDAGDKTHAYGAQSYINSLLDQNIAFATINYRFLGSSETIGLKKPIGDVLYALQFIKYHSESLNINPDKIILQGTSAGSGSAMWIAFNDDQKDELSSDPIKRLSSKVRAVIATEVQATYDLVKWENIFSTYSLNTTSLLASKIMAFYGIDDAAKVTNPEVVTYRGEFDFLEFMDNADPELWLENKSVDNVSPSNSSELLHHPLHAKALKDKADSVGLTSQFYIPKMSISDSASESQIDFILRVSL